MDNMEKKIRVGLLGIGGRARHFADLVRQYPKTELAAVCDISEEAMARSVEEKNLYDIPQYTDYMTMLNEESLDVVFVCTPIEYHCDHTIMALEKGVHVVGEVPVAFNIEQAKQMVQAVKNQKPNTSSGRICVLQSMSLLSGKWYWQVS